MSEAAQVFEKETEIIMDLMSEVDEICRENSIRYFLTDDLLLLALEEIDNRCDSEEGDDNEDDDYDDDGDSAEHTSFSDDRHDNLGRSSRSNDDEDDNVRSGTILMDPADFLRFVSVVENSDKKDRCIEWMGNNPEFPGLYARYVNTATVHYTPFRLSYEKNLGMHITINVLRPKDDDKVRYMWIERFWRNWATGFRPSRKLERAARHAFDFLSAIMGKDRFAKWFAKKLLGHYSKVKNNGNVWIRREAKMKSTDIPAQLFDEVTVLSLNGREFTTACDPELFSEYARHTSICAENNHIEFSDATIPFKDLHLEDFSEDISSFVVFRENFISRPDIIRHKRRWKKMLRILLRTYYRYYFGINIYDNIDEYERMLKEGRVKELSRELKPYRDAIMANGCVYLNDRMTDIMAELYGEVVERKLKNKPDIFDDGIRIYDYKGEYQKTIGDSQ